jgi:hypothetical protein
MTTFLQNIDSLVQNFINLIHVIENIRKTHRIGPATARLRK